MIDRDDGADLDPRIVELLTRWTWDPADLDDAERAELEASPEAQARMAEIRTAEDGLRRAADAERAAVLEHVRGGDGAGVPAGFAAELQQLRSDGPQPGSRSRARGWWVAGLAAAALLLMIWGVGQIEWNEDGDTPLGQGGVAVEWRADTGEIRWEGAPPPDGVIRVRAFAGGAQLMERSFYAGDPEWGARSYAFPRDRMPDAFEYEVLFFDAFDARVRHSGRQTARW